MPAAQAVRGIAGSPAGVLISPAVSVQRNEVERSAKAGSAGVSPALSAQPKRSGAQREQTIDELDTERTTRRVLSEL
jgi:hypothetical protein